MEILMVQSLTFSMALNSTGELKNWGLFTYKFFFKCILIYGVRSWYDKVLMIIFWSLYHR